MEPAPWERDDALTHHRRKKDEKCAAMEPAPWERDDLDAAVPAAHRGGAAMEPAPWERDDGSLKTSRMTCVFVAACERCLAGFRIASTDGVFKVRNRWLTSTRALPRNWVTTTALAGSDDDRA